MRRKEKNWCFGSDYAEGSLSLVIGEKPGRTVIGIDSIARRGEYQRGSLNYAAISIPFDLISWSRTCQVSSLKSFKLTGCGSILTST